MLTFAPKKFPEILAVPADFTTPHRFDLADRLSAQEAALPEDAPDSTGAVTKRYRKFPHLLKPHSWAPVWFNIDNVRSLSMDFGYETASLGATVASDSLGRPIVNSMLDDSEAAMRGLDLGDRLTSFGGRTIQTANEFKNVLGIYLNYD